MKLVYYIPALLMLFAFTQETLSQATQEGTRRQRRTEAAEASSNTATLTERARIKNEENSRVLSQAAWTRELTRILDLAEEANAPLMFPAEPIGDRRNLFTHIFYLVVEGKVKAYNYIDGKEVFTDSERIDIGKMLEAAGINAAREGEGENARYRVEELDVPGADVNQYILKETWYFDQAAGMFGSKVTALCPILVRMDYATGITNREPLFWVEYEDIRPYISREMIMTSNYNNVLTYSLDDYFSKRMYDGEIIKSANMRNLSLQEQVSEQLMKQDEAAARARRNLPEAEIDANNDDFAMGDDSEDVFENAMKAARDSIENQIRAFEKQLWVQPDTTTTTANNKKAEKTNTKVEKPKETKAEKSSSAPTRSVRRR